LNYWHSVHVTDFIFNEDSLGVVYLVLTRSLDITLIIFYRLQLAR